MFFAVVFDDFRSRVGAVAKGLSARQTLELFYHVIGKTVRIGRHRLWRNNARYFPMPDRCVFTCRTFGKAGESCFRAVFFFAERNAVYIEQSQLFKGGNVEFTRIIARFKGIASRIAERRGIGKFAYTETVGNKNKNPHLITPEYQFF